jgi:hypothetical protein
VPLTSHTLRSISTASCAVSRWPYPPGVGLIDGKKRVKRKAPCTGPSFIDRSRSYALAAGMCAGAMPTSYVWTLSSLEPPAEAP